MAVEVRPATEVDVRVFSAWRYDPPYDVYSISQEPDAAVEYFLSSQVDCHVLVEGGDVIGFVTFGSDAQVPGGDYTKDALDIGLGIDPALTGRGSGRRYITAVVDFMQSAPCQRPLRVTIAAGNERALRVWRSIGFKETADFISPETVMGTKKFVMLEFG